MSWYKIKEGRYEYITYNTPRPGPRPPQFFGPMKEQHFGWKHQKKTGNIIALPKELPVKSPSVSPPIPSVSDIHKVRKFD